MDPFEFARQHGQVIGLNPDIEEPEDGENLMELLLRAFVAAGHLATSTEDGQAVAGRFVTFGNKYLATHRVVSTGMVNGEFSLVFESGQVVPLATSPPVPGRPDSTIPITSPRDSKMKGMPVMDNSVPVTTGQVAHLSGSLADHRVQALVRAVHQRVRSEDAIGAA